MLLELFFLLRSLFLRLAHYVNQFNPYYPLKHSQTTLPTLAYVNEKDSEILTLPGKSALSLSFGPNAIVPTQCIHNAFRRVSKHSPQLIAVEHLGQSLTYAELDHLSDILASRLISLGVTRGTRVCLLVQRSLEMVVGIFAVLKAGASYVPLDGGIVTDSTLTGILEDARPKAILCISKFQNRASGRTMPYINVDIQELLMSAELVSRHEPYSLPSDEAYVIYTSGTTGRPKGVSVSHGNVTNVLCTYPGNLSIRPGTRVSQLLNIAFDMCAWEILATLTNGGTLVLRGSSRESWHATLSTVQVVISTPSVLAQFEPRKYPNVRVVATAGERCPQRLADEWASCGRAFWNCCGPTETTIINTAHLHSAGSLNTIGRPTPNNSVYVLDDELRPVPLGQPGTLWAGGAGVCRGYVNLPELTQTRFKPDPYNPRGSWMYNTGDLGRLLPSGEFEHLGRQDDQVKLKGFRVELDGVAASIAACPGVVLSAAIVVRSSDGSEDDLCAFYTPASISEADVKRSVQMTQPYYAVPKRFIGLAEMPLTKNGKVDKVALKSMLS